MNVTSSILVILAAMAAIAALETWIPLKKREPQARAHLRPNLVLSLLTFVTNALTGAALMMGLAWLQQRDLGLLNAFALPPLAALAVVVVALDFAFYLVHVAMHRRPALWRFHAVHHSDPIVDVTTTIRQHPVEGLIRDAFTSASALALGAAPAAYAVYRVAVALNGLLEHANLRAPLGLDRALAIVTTWPHMHKVHHSREAEQTDTNYGNLFSFWDRIFGTFTPSHLGTGVVYGLDGYDDPATQSTAGLLALPFRAIPASLRVESTACTSAILPASSSSMRSSDRGA